MAIDLTKIKNILIVRPEMLGDTILLTPLVSAIKRKLPQARITLLLRSPAQEILKNNPQVDEVILLQPWFDLLKEVKKRKFDLSIVLEDNPSPEYALLCFFAGIRYRIGDKNRLLYRWAFNQPAAIDLSNKNLHQVQIHAQLLKPLGIDQVTEPSSIFPDQKDQHQIRKRLEKYGLLNQSLIGIHVGTGGGNKALLAETYALLADNLQKATGKKIIIFGGASELSTAQKIKAAATLPYLDLVNQLTLGELLALIKCLNLFVGVDSGPLHAAAALKIPIIAIYTAKDVIPARWVPWQARYVKILTKHDCPLPCSHRECIEDTCSRYVDIQEVVEAAHKLL